MTYRASAPRASLLLTLGAFLLTLMSHGAVAAPVTLTVESNEVLRHHADRFVGVNLNDIRDADANRPGVSVTVLVLRTARRLPPAH